MGPVVSIKNKNIIYRIYCKLDSSPFPHFNLISGKGYKFKGSTPWIKSLYLLWRLICVWHWGKIHHKTVRHFTRTRTQHLASLGENGVQDNENQEKITVEIPGIMYMHPRHCVRNLAWFRVYYTHRGWMS